MSELLKIAWRNIWRNKKRTLITISSIFFATFLALIMRSFQLGTYDYIINSMVEMYSGYIVIEQKDFKDDKTIDNSIVYSPKTMKKLLDIENVTNVVPRLSSFAFASSKSQTKNVLITGISVDIENKMTKLENMLVKYKISENKLNEISKNKKIPKEIISKLKENYEKGYSRKDFFINDIGLEENNEISKILLETFKYKSNFLKKNDKGILVGSLLAKYLKLNVGDTLTLIGQGFHGASAEGLFVVKGIIHFPSPQLDKLIVYTSLQQSQDFFSCIEYGEESDDTIKYISSYAINLKRKNDKNIQRTKQKIISELNSEDYVVSGWEEHNKELSQQIATDNKSGQAMLVIFYVVIAFGIFGTVLMMIAERKREMGVMIALGMRKFKLAIIITFEIIFLSIIGLFLGVLASIPFVFLGHYYPVRLTGEMADMMIDMGFEPVMPMAWFGEYYINQIYVLLLIVLLVMIYPVITILRIKLIEALRK